jgi:PKD domain
VTLPRVVLGFAVIAAGFGAAFVIGNATADSERGRVGNPASLRLSAESARVPTLSRVASVPALGRRERRGGESVSTVPPPGPVGDGGGNTTTATTTARNRPPTAAFTATPVAVLTDEKVQFNAGSSRDADGWIVSYQWDLDGDGKFDADAGTASTAARSYSTSGTKTVELQVTDNGGATSTTTVPVEVKDPEPPKE